MACTCQQPVYSPFPRTRIRVVVADPDPARRAVIREVLLATAGFELLAETTAASELARIVSAEEPELVVGCLPVLLRADVADHAFPLCIAIGFAPVASETRTVATLAESISAGDIEEALSAATASILNAKASELSRLIRQYVLHCDMPVAEPLMLEVDRDGVRTEIAADTIEWIKAAGNYVRIHAATGEFLMRSSIRSVASRLERHGFLRVHRTRVVNANSIRLRLLHDDGAITLVLLDGTEISVGPGYRELVLKNNLVAALQ